MTDIVDRLRKQAIPGDDVVWISDLTEAADEIERLRAALDAAKDGLTVAYFAGHESGKDLSAAKIGLLTAALEFGLDLVGQDDLEGKAGWDAFVISANEARAALSQKEGE